MRLDEFLPSAEFGEAHAIWVAAPPERALEAVKAVEPRETALTRLLFAVRVLPARLAGKWKRPRGQSLYELLLDQGFVTLAEEPARSSSSASSAASGPCARPSRAGWPAPATSSPSPSPGTRRLR